jgi:hypothetical protein
MCDTNPIDNDDCSHLGPSIFATSYVITANKPKNIA